MLSRNDPQTRNPAKYLTSVIVTILAAGIRLFKKMKRATALAAALHFQ